MLVLLLGDRLCTDLHWVCLLAAVEELNRLVFFVLLVHCLEHALAAHSPRQALVRLLDLFAKLHERLGNPSVHQALVVFCSLLSALAVEMLRAALHHRVVNDIGRPLLMLMLVEIDR